MINWVSNVVSNVKSAFASPVVAIADPYYYLPTQALNGINFIDDQLCPPKLSTEQTSHWVGQYLGKLPESQYILFKGTDDVAHIAYCHQQQHFSFRLSNIKVARNHALYVDDVNADNHCHVIKNLRDVAISLSIEHEVDLPGDLILADINDLKAQKNAVYFENKIITTEMIEAEKESLDQIIENIEAATTCPICLDDYTQESPPMLFSSGHTYHGHCFMQHGERELEMHSDYITDPLNRARIELYEDDELNDVIKPNLTLKGILEDVRNYESRSEKLVGMINILLEKNQTLTQELVEVRAQQAPALDLPVLEAVPAQDELAVDEEENPIPKSRRANHL